MNILMLSTDFLPNIGGIAAHIVGLSSALKRLGHIVTVVVPRPTYPWLLPWTHKEHIQNFNVIRLGIPAIPRLGQLYYKFYIANWLQRFIRSEYDVVHWHTFEEDVVRRLKISAKVFTNHTSYFLECVANGERMQQTRRIVKPADMIIAPSRQLAQATVSAGYPDSLIRIISNGVDTEFFSNTINGQYIRQRYDIASDECVILCPRRLEKKNGVIYWVRAIPILLLSCKIRVRFLFVGDYQFDDEYSERQEVLSGIAELGLGNQIIFTGAVPNQEMPYYFAASDIVVIPSLMEATSIAGLEAMSSGKPIVGTTVGGIPEIVSDGETGYLVPSGDSAALAEAAGRLVESPHLREIMGKAARKKAVREFDWLSIAEKTVDVYKEAIRLHQ